MKSQDESPIDRDDLIERITSKLSHLFKKYSINFAILAGSWARGQQSWWSDVDIFVSYPKYANKSVKDRLKTLIDLNVTAEIVTKLSNIEIRILEKQALHVQYDLLKDGIIIYQKSKKTPKKYLEQLMHKYFDHMKWYTRYLDESLTSR